MMHVVAFAFVSPICWIASLRAASNAGSTCETICPCFECSLSAQVTHNTRWNTKSMKWPIIHAGRWYPISWSSFGLTKTAGYRIFPHLITINSESRKFFKKFSIDILLCAWRISAQASWTVECFSIAKPLNEPLGKQVKAFLCLPVRCATNQLPTEWCQSTIRM